MPPLRITRHRLRQSLRASVAEGMAAEVVSAFSGASVMTAWALHLGSSALVVGLLSALPLASNVFHFPGAWLVGRFGARRVALVSVTAARQVLWPLAALPFVPIDDRGRESVLIVVAASGAVLAVVGNNAWQAWMAELVPNRLRGRYFGHRTSVCLFAGSLGSLGAGAVLDAARRSGAEEKCLSIFAVVACAAGLLATWLMRQQHDPGGSRVAPRWRVLLSPIVEPRVGRVLAFIVPWNLAIGVSSASFTIYELREMKLGFAAVASLGVLTATVRLVSAPWWGRVIDRLGVRPVLVTLSFLIVLIPLPWLWASDRVVWPVVLDALLSGLLWSGHTLAMSQLPIRISTPTTRPQVLAACSAGAGLAFGIAAIGGGAMAVTVPLTTLFIASSGLRLIAATLSLRVVDPGARPVVALGQFAMREARAGVRWGLGLVT